MIETSIVLFKGNLLSELDLILIYFSSQSSQFLVIDLIKYMVLFHSSPYFFIFSVDSRNQHEILISINLFKVSIYFTENKVQGIYTINFYVFRTFRRHISNIVHKIFLYDFSSILILFRSKFSILIISFKSNMFGFLGSYLCVLQVIFFH